MAATGEAPTLFLRKATGLVKGWSKFDAFLYSFMSVNFVTLGLFFSLSVLGFVPNGQILSALLVTGIFMTFLVIMYAGLIFFTDAIFAMLKFLMKASSASLVSPTQNLAQLGDVIFRVPPRHDTPAALSLLVIVFLLVASIVILERKVRGVEVVA